MTTSEKLAKWVAKKPILLIRFDGAYSESLLNSRNGFESLTLVKPHATFDGLKLPTLCLLETIQGDDVDCYLATATRKTAVSTFDSRLTLKKLRKVQPESLSNLGAIIAGVRHQKTYAAKLPLRGDIAILTPKLSAEVVTALASREGNLQALDVALSQLPRLRQAPNINWAQEDAIQTAMAAFGIRVGEQPAEISLKKGAISGLAYVGAHLYEDNVVHSDATRLPGFSTVSQDLTGRAVFQRRDERLVIYTANKLPLEKMLGVDLIYVNETRGNIVMVQYKMLEESRSSGETDWQFRPDKQLRAEIARMRLPVFSGSIDDYRLSRDPFYFKFVKRKVVDDSHQSFLISLGHLQQLMGATSTKGPRDGVRLSYEALHGTYLREADILSLIRSGYIGTHRSETAALATIIASVSQGNRALVLAWQQKLGQAEGKS